MLSPGGESDASLESGLESMRIKLAIMKVREEMMNEPSDEVKSRVVYPQTKLEAIEQLESHLEQIQNFEKTSFKSDNSVNIDSSPTKAPVSKVVLKAKVTAQNSPILTQIQSQVNCLNDLMTSTFEALLLKLESCDSTAPQEPNPPMAKKAREFETRFQRQIFEGKQKVRSCHQ